MVKHIEGDLPTLLAMQQYDLDLRDSRRMRPVEEAPEQSLSLFEQKRAKVTELLEEDTSWSLPRDTGLSAAMEKDHCDCRRMEDRKVEQNPDNWSFDTDNVEAVTPGDRAWLDKVFVSSAKNSKLER